MTPQAWRVRCTADTAASFAITRKERCARCWEARSGGLHTFGVSEQPRGEARFLYEEEIARGGCGKDHGGLCPIYAGSSRARRGVRGSADRAARLFEAEVVPTQDYIRQMRSYREGILADGSPAFDYFVGSVHYVDEMQIDGPPEGWRRAAEAFGGPEALAARYYETVAEMTEALRPDVVGHLDLIKKNAAAAGFDAVALDSPRIPASLPTALWRRRGCERPARPEHRRMAQGAGRAVPGSLAGGAGEGDGAAVLLRRRQPSSGSGRWNGCRKVAIICFSVASGRSAS